MTETMLAMFIVVVETDRVSCIERAFCLFVVGLWTVHCGDGCEERSVAFSLFEELHVPLPHRLKLQPARASEVSEEASLEGAKQQRKPQ